MKQVHRLFPIFPIFLSHYNAVHANEPNFRVACSIDGCPATFNLYNSFYKHVLKYHKELYNEKLLDTDESYQGKDDNNTQAENNDDECNHINQCRITCNEEIDRSCSSSDEFEYILDQEQVKYSSISYMFKWIAINYVQKEYSVELSFYHHA